MGMHTDEWLKLDKEQSEKYGLCLDRSQYKLDFIKIPFGDEYIPIPQDGRHPEVISRLGISPLDEELIVGNMYDLARLAGVEGKEHEEGYIYYTKEDTEKMEAAMPELIREKGPYYVINKAYWNSYEWEMEYCINGGEREFIGGVTRKDLEEIERQVKNNLLKEELMLQIVAQYSRTLEALASGEAIDEEEFFASNI